MSHGCKRTVRRASDRRQTSCDASRHITDRGAELSSQGCLIRCIWRQTHVPNLVGRFLRSRIPEVLNRVLFDQRSRHFLGSAGEVRRAPSDEAESVPSPLALFVACLCLSLSRAAQKMPRDSCRAATGLSFSIARRSFVGHRAISQGVNARCIRKRLTIAVHAQSLPSGA
jgi:hypothetical protein